MIPSFWIPLKTLVFIIGVLQWQDPSLATYEQKGRHDQLLYEILGQRGVPKNNMIYLQDKKATLANINKEFETLLKKSDTGSTFFFYYAGHGQHSKDGKKTYFLNYDCKTSDSEKYCLSLSTIEEMIRKYFKGKLVILTADCCYSGALNEVANNLTKSGIESIVFTSAVSSNSSTGAWTFTESLNEILGGIPFMKLTDKKITIKNAGDYICNNMKYADWQLGNYFHTAGISDNFVLSTVNSKYTNSDHFGEIKQIWWKDKNYTCRIIGQKENKYLIHYFGWGKEWDEWREYGELKDFEFNMFPVGDKIQVEWGDVWYPSIIIKQKDVFHYIKYEGWGDEWNEWVASDRIKY